MADHFGLCPATLYHVAVGELAEWRRRLSGEPEKERSASRIWRDWQRHQQGGGDVDSFVRRLTGGVAGG